jgi:hypothetical protein
VNPYWASEQIFADARGARRLVTVLGGSHLGPLTSDPVEVAVGVLVADFLRGELAGDGDARGRVDGDANRDGLVLAAA